MSRTGTSDRTTRETSISVTWELDGSGQSDARTGIGFFDHMLELFAKHGLFDIRVRAEGDLHVDLHHTVEDTGIALGQALAMALGEKAGIVRYGTSYIPMDESLVRCVADLGGRPYLSYHPLPDTAPITSDFPFQLMEEFLRALSTQAAMNLHIDVLRGRDSHHMAEAIFKSLARALDAATRIDPRVAGIPSTKGTL